MAQFPAMPAAQPIPDLIRLLYSARTEDRTAAARGLFALGSKRAKYFAEAALGDPEFSGLIVFHKSAGDITSASDAKITVGIAVAPDTFEKIHNANGAPPLDAAPADQDVAEFELQFSPNIQLDILTTNMPGSGGAIDRFLSKFGEGIQQVELDVTDINRATDILRARFQWEPIYPATRAGADATRVNFFLVPDGSGKNLLL